MTSVITTCINIKNAGFLHPKHILGFIKIKNLKQIIPTSSYQCRYYAKEVYKREKPHCNIGTIGHIDHGKTTLTAAITKILSEKKLAVQKKFEEIDHTPEEQARGITINYTSIGYSTENRHYGHMDCPGHADYIKNMITGTSLMDGAILVVAGSEGVMPQTKEHVLLSKQIGLRHIVVYINKADAADKDMLELVELEVRDLLNEMGFDGDVAPVVCGSALFALQGKNDELGKNSVLKLLDAVDAYIPTPVRDLDKPFVLPIDAVYHIKNRGTVVSGRLEKGKISKGQQVEVIGYDEKLKSTVSSLEMFHETLEEAHAGDKCGLMLRGLKKQDVRRGMFLVQPRSMDLCNKLETQVYLMTKEEGGREWPVLPYMKVEIHSKCWEMGASILIPGKEMVLPGENALFEVLLANLMPVEEGQRFTVRHKHRTIGMGVVARIQPNMTLEDKEDLRLSKEKRELNKTAPVKKRKK